MSGYGRKNAMVVAGLALVAILLWPSPAGTQDRFVRMVQVLDEGVRHLCPYATGPWITWTNTTGRTLKIWKAQLILNVTLGYADAGGFIWTTEGEYVVILGHSSLANGMTPKMAVVDFPVPLRLPPGAGLAVFTMCEARSLGAYLDALAFVWVE